MTQVTERLHDGDLQETEIGKLPRSWDVKPIGELFDVQQGKALSEAARNGPSLRPFLRTANVLWSRLNLTHLDEMSFDEAEAKRLALRSGDLLVCEGGEIGRTAIWEGEVPDCLYQNHIHRLRAKSGDVLAPFVMYWLRAAFTLFGLYGGVGNRTTIPNLSASRLKQLSIPVPSRKHQERVVEILSTVQRKVENQERMVTSLRQLKSATLSKLFREGLRGEPLKQTEIGEIPESWEVALMADAVIIAKGQVDPRSEPYASLLHVGPENIEEATGKLLACKSARESSLISGKYEFKAGDLLYSKIRPYLRKAVSPGFDGVCSADIYPLRLLEGFDGDYLLGCLLSEVVTTQLVAQQARTGIPKVNRQQLATIGIPVPPEMEQVEIGRMFRSLHEIYEKSVARLAGLADLFSASLTRLMSKGYQMSTDRSDSTDVMSRVVRERR